MIHTSDWKEEGEVLKLATLAFATQLHGMRTFEGFLGQATQEMQDQKKKKNCHAFIK